MCPIHSITLRLLLVAFKCCFMPLQGFRAKEEVQRFGDPMELMMMMPDSVHLHSSF
jgi:hypothetical protein